MVCVWRWHVWLNNVHARGKPSYVLLVRVHAFSTQKILSQYPKLLITLSYSPVEYKLKILIQHCIDMWHNHLVLCMCACTYSYQLNIFYEFYWLNILASVVYDVCKLTALSIAIALSANSYILYMLDSYTNTHR